MKLWIITLALGKHSERDRKWGKARRLVMAATIDEAAIRAKADIDADFAGSYYGPATHWNGREVADGICFLSASTKLDDGERDDMVPFATGDAVASRGGSDA